MTVLRVVVALIALLLLAGTAHVVVWPQSDPLDLEVATWTSVMAYELKHPLEADTRPVEEVFVDEAIGERIDGATWRRFSEQLAARGIRLSTAADSPVECLETRTCGWHYVFTEYRTPFVAKTNFMYFVGDLNGDEVWMAYVLGRWRRLYHRNRWQ